MNSPSKEHRQWPAEWEQHEATWMTWPTNPATWPGKFNRIPAAYAELVRVIARFEPVRLLHRPVDREAIRSLVGETRYPVDLIDVPTNDAWVRDYGPTFVRATNGGNAPNLAGIDWNFNAWGEKYSPFDLDQACAARVLEQLKQERIVSPLCLEGGAVEGNGAGRLMTTRSCVLSPARNPHLTASQAETHFSQLLGIDQVLWLTGDGLSGDDTDGHIDQLARFVAEDVVVVAVAASDDDENSLPLQRNLLHIADAWDDVEVWPLPTPRRRWQQGRRLPCSYCNFIFVNGGLIVPAFDDPLDAEAVALLQGLLPHREVIACDSLDLVWGLGSFHCLTQQQPAPGR